MIATSSTSFFQSLLAAPTLLDLSGSAFTHNEVLPLHFSKQQQKEQLVRSMASTSSSDDITAKGKPARKLTRRQLKHREAMVRFRLRKKAKISVLEAEELKLQKLLRETLNQFYHRDENRTTTVDELLGLSDPRVAIQRAFAEAVLEIEEVLDEADALEDAIAEQEKFHATLKRVREKCQEDSIWKCV